jgi:hypothetical protein
MHHRFLLHNNRRPNFRCVEKWLRHSDRDANAAVRCGVGRDVALMHRVTAAKEHRVRHARAIIMGAGWFRILAHIDVGFHDVAKIVHVIAEDSRDVRGIFRQDRVMARRSPEARFAGRNRGFADEIFAFVKIGVLLRDADDDLRRTRNAVAVPIAHGRRRRSDCRRRRWVFGAAREKGSGGEGAESSNEGPASHLDAQSNASGSGFNPKDLAPTPTGRAEKLAALGVVVLAQNAGS